MTDTTNNSQTEQNDYVLASELEANSQETVDTTATEPKKPEPKLDQPEQQPEKKKMGGYQRRIHNLQKEVEHWKSLAAQQQPVQQPTQQQPVQQPQTKAGSQQSGSDPEPQPQDYDDVFKFMADHNRWAARQAVNEFKTQQQTEQQEAAANQEYEEKQLAFNEKAEAILEHVPDFWERAEQLYHAGLVTPHLENAILDSDMGPMVSLYLMANPQELQMITTMNEGQTYRAVTLIENHLKSGAGNMAQRPTPAAGQRVPNQQPVKRTTQAPAPIKPIRAQAQTQETDPDKMSMEEFRKWREAGGGS